MILEIQVLNSRVIRKVDEEDTLLDEKGFLQSLGGNM